MNELLKQRRAGILLHPTSLPSGDLSDAQAWLDFMAQAGLSIWQMLPLTVPLADRSPYQSASAFAVNPDLLPNYPPIEEDHHLFQLFCQEQQHWLPDYALFMQIKTLQQGKNWVDWPAELKWRQPQALARIRQQYHQELMQIQWQQFQLYQHWQQIRQYADQYHILLFGDLPLFIAHDSADVWAHPQRFLLDEQGQPTYVAGVPPDYFSKTGQRWGNPHYDWDYHQQEQFNWWIERLHHHFAWFDLIRIDHFRGLQAVWMIKADEPTAIHGFWQEVPGDQLLAQLQHSMGENLPLVAEDLGIITEAVKALKQKYQLPGMAILQFAFDAFEDNPHKPQNIGKNTVVYTGTHDNDTTLGWYQSLSPEEQAFVRQSLGMEAGADIVQTLIETALQTQAGFAIIPLQDFLRLGSEARMNTPGTTEGNWQWQFQWSQLSPELAQSIQQQVEHSARGIPA